MLKRRLVDIKDQLSLSKWSNYLDNHDPVISEILSSVDQEGKVIVKLKLKTDL
jgi:hypothetical protein